MAGRTGSRPSATPPTILNPATRSRDPKLPSHSLRAEPHWVSAHRRRPFGALQLAIFAPPWRKVPAAYRRHRPAAERGGGAGADSARLPLARPRLGRRPRGGRPLRP